jgi:hypothetical protein
LQSKNPGNNLKKLWAMLSPKEERESTTPDIAFTNFAKFRALFTI